MANGLRAVRKEKGLTQMKLAEKANVHRTIIARYETGRHSLSQKSLVKIAHALDVSADRILEGGEQDGAAS